MRGEAFAFFLLIGFATLLGEKGLNVLIRGQVLAFFGS
jgi:hypothetical protein